jgi:asparagine synthase (glutamine-hydrolysing)
MCGIIGAIGFGKTPLSFTGTKFDSLMAEMAYRGPDARDQWKNPEQNVHLGHLRLSIQDLRPEGTQPMHLNTVNGQFTIVFNGEVYNFIEIAEELKELGYTFNTTTDTEVILTAYAAWGEDCLNKFNGMFSIAIWDNENQSLFVARDRLGIKPLYYHHSSNGLVFASEIKSLRPLIEEDTGIDTYLLDQYMIYGYIPGNKTLNKGIYRLLPGNKMTFVKGKLSVKTYWSLNFTSPSKKHDMGLDYYIEQGKKIFQNSLKLRMRADVPMGIFLSGGLDSSAVVASLKDMGCEDLRTFSVRYDMDKFGSEFDESVYAEQVSKMFNTKHKTYTMTPEDFERYIPEFVKTMDEPVTEAAAISLHYVSELAKQDVTVVLSGEGSDEIFGGYDLYRYMGTIENIRNVITPTGCKIAKVISDTFLPSGNKIKKYVDLANMPFEQRYRGISVYDQSHKQELYKDDTMQGIIQDSPEINFNDKVMSESKEWDLLSRMLHFDTKTWLVDDLLTKADRMSMGSSLELRVPFLDYKFVEFAASLPSKYKIFGKEGKYILKKMMEGLLPDNIIYREKKGFPTPLKLMFQGPLREYVNRTLVLNDNAMIERYFDMSYVAKLCREHWDGSSDHHRILWQLIVLEEWLRQNTPKKEIIN